MPTTSRIPPGRAGRMWLHRRIDTAVRGRDQLDRKLRILLPEQQRLRIQADRTRAAWEAACATANEWLLRAALVGGEDAVRHAAAAGLVRLKTVDTTSMGVRYPVAVEVTEAATSTAPADNAAVPPAAAAFRTALLAGTRAAAAAEAVRRLDAEVLVTRRRLRALDKRWLPWLRGEMKALELSLEQTEHDDGTRLRRAVRGTSERRSTT